MSHETDGTQQDNGSASIWRALSGCFMPIALALSLGWVMMVAAIAFENLKSEEVEGRWLPRDRENNCPDGPFCKQRFDFSKCGKDWCGVEVAHNGQCGRIAFRLTVVAADKGEDEWFVKFGGQYSAAEDVEPYVVDGRLVPSNDVDKIELLLKGHTGGKFQAFRREYPLEMDMVRVGDALCKGDGKVP
jgi:hypothetical protein